MLSSANNTENKKIGKSEKYVTAEEARNMIFQQASESDDKKVLFNHNLRSNYPKQYEL